MLSSPDSSIFLQLPTTVDLRSHIEQINALSQIMQFSILLLQVRKKYIIKIKIKILLIIRITNYNVPLTIISSHSDIYWIKLETRLRNIFKSSDIT